jgi:hypothetical protein
MNTTPRLAPSTLQQADLKQLLEGCLSPSLVDGHRLIHAIIDQYDAFGFSDSEIATALNNRRVSGSCWTPEKVGHFREMGQYPEWSLIKECREKMELPAFPAVTQEECLARFAKELRPIMESKKDEKWMWARCAKALNEKGIRDPFGRRFTTHWILYWYSQVTDTRPTRHN